MICFVPFCKHRSDREGCGFYTFPRDEKTKQIWIRNIRTTGVDKVPKKCSLVCRCHFREHRKDYGPTIFRRSKEQIAKAGKLQTPVVSIVQKRLAMPGAEMPVATLPIKAEKSQILPSESKSDIKPVLNGINPVVNGTITVGKVAINPVGKIAIHTVVKSINKYEDLKEINHDINTNLNKEGSSQRLDIFKRCQKISTTTYQPQNTVMNKETKEFVSQYKGITSDIDILRNQISAFIKTRTMIFLTPVSTLKNDPQFRTLYSSALNEGLRKTPLASVTDSVVRESQIIPDGLEVLSVVRSKANLPPEGEFKRKEITPGMKVYVMKQSQVGEFGVGLVLTIREAEPDKLFKVRLENVKTNSFKLFTAKQLAYMDPWEVKIPVGTRICARYSDGVRTAVYAGIIAEPPKITNNARYLIFFDDGYAQYIYHQDIFVMCAQSNDVADDVHENLKEFIKAYLQKFPERPMVKLQKDESTKTEFECKWWDTKVLEIDASMVKMFFTASNRTEWIYRGSTRLKLLFDELQNAEEHRRSGKNRRHNIVARKPHQPYVEYTREEEVVTLDSDESDNESQSSAKYSHPRRKTGGSQYGQCVEDSVGKQVRNTARKSGSGQPRCQTGTCNAPLKYRSPDIRSHLGFRETRCRCSFCRTNYEVHTCSRLCKEKEDPIKMRGNNPMLTPIYLGWERQVRKYRKKRYNQNKFKVMYRAPCGRHLRNLQEILDFLIITKSQISIDFFSVDPTVIVFRTFRPKEILYENPDITNGGEKVFVSCINSWTPEPPPPVEYAAQRFPGKNVNLNLDPEFLCGCDCKDYCVDPLKCQCMQITSYAKNGRIGEDVGYKFRRLKEPIVTGIYECNSKCKCGPQCGNRVVQNGLLVRLQMFKTERKGWGIRCLDDLDAGQFICIYAGQLLTDEGANEDGNQYGDEYLAELDHIEVAERTKEGYESDVEEPEETMDVEVKNDNKSDISDDDDDPNDPDASFSSDDLDSDFEPGIRSTAITSLSTRRSRKKTKLSLSLSSVKETPESDDSEMKRKRGLPDLSTTLDMITITPRALSPECAEYVDNIDYIRTPKLPDNVSNSKPVAKKSVNCNAKQTASQLKNKKDVKYKPIRAYYGEESCYIMDAKSKGNIGRYLNHSCSPNVFVQNVFTDTHDLRFPAIAFFAMHYILAGTELTWDYNYEVGSVVDKVMYCYCDARTCRGRLL